MSASCTKTSSFAIWLSHYIAFRFFFSFFRLSLKFPNGKDMHVAVVFLFLAPPHLLSSPNICNVFSSCREENWNFMEPPNMPVTLIYRTPALSYSSLFFYDSSLLMEYFSNMDSELDRRAHSSGVLASNANSVHPIVDARIQLLNF